VIKCEKCGAETANARFCSNSCRASVTNLGVRRHGSGRGPCANCGIPLYPPQRTYCSEACAQDARRRAIVEAWLATGAPGQTHLALSIRAYILEDQGGCCAICGMAREWNGMPLVFVLDHIDGNSSDNSRANVRLVCPNCDSQLPTYKSRNRGNGRHFRRVRYANGQSF